MSSRTAGPASTTGFAAWVRSRRVALLLTQEQLAERAGLSGRPFASSRPGPSPRARARGNCWALCSARRRAGGPRRARACPYRRSCHRTYTASRDGPLSWRRWTACSLGRTANRMRSSSPPRPGPPVSARPPWRFTGRRVADRFPDGQLFLDLRRYGPDDPLPAATALEVLLLDLGVGAAQLPQRLDQRMARYRSLVADRRMLVLLDNARSADQVRPLLPGSGTCLVVVTSRDSLSAWSPATALAVWTLTFCPSPTRCCCCVPSSASGWMPNYRRGATGRPPDLVPGPAGGTAGRRAPAAGRAHRG